MNFWKNRKPFKEAPFFAMGPFKLRFPFIHYRFEISDYLQGLLMCAVDLAAIPLMVELLGMPFEAALAIVILNGLLYLTHHLLGDPVVPGWITPAIPLLILYVETFPEGPDRVHALVAFQMTLGLLAVLLGITKMAKKVVAIIPSAIKSGIIMGAGIAAVVTVFETEGRFDQFPFSISLSVGLAFYLIFSNHFKRIAQEYRFLNTVGKLGIFPIIMLAVVLGPLFMETPWPKLEFGFSNPDFGLMISDYTIIGLGLPPFSMFIKAVPMALAAYVVLFGDVLQAEAILKEGDSLRPDEKVEYNVDRA
ncbi:MAG: hypothetical protein AAFP96_03960, partial [Bacteroidota bacterium]